MSHDPPETGHLSLWDAVSIIIGIVVGTAIFKAPQQIASSTETPWHAMGAWVLGGVLALVGAFCYAELTTAYPRSGGDYNYLTRAFGRPIGFLFGFAQLGFVITGSIGVMAFAFADYVTVLWGFDVQTPEGLRANYGLALGAVLALTAINMAGVVAGKFTQNVLTLVKVIGLVLVAIAAFCIPAGTPPPAGRSFPNLGFGVAMVMVLYAYGGWNDAAFVAAEVRDRKRDLPRALIFGVLGITVVYLLVNGAYFLALGTEGVRNSPEPAAHVAQMAFGENASRAVSALVAVSALGAINGLIFAGSRVYAVLGGDHAVFRWLGSWSPGKGVPLASLAVQAVVTVLLMFVVATPQGREIIDAQLTRTGMEAIPWGRFGGGFESLVAVTAPVFWVFFLLTGLALFALREIDKDIPRPFRVPFYPFTPFVFCLTSVYMLKSSIEWAGQLSWLGVILLAIGVAMYPISQWLSRNKA